MKYHNCQDLERTSPWPRPQDEAAECPRPRGECPAAPASTCPPATTCGLGAEPQTARYWAATTRWSSHRSRVKTCQNLKASQTETKPRSRCRSGARRDMRRRRRGHQWRGGGGQWGPRVSSGRNTPQTRTKLSVDHIIITRWKFLWTNLIDNIAIFSPPFECLTEDYVDLNLTHRSSHNCNLNIMCLLFIILLWLSMNTSFNKNQCHE